MSQDNTQVRQSTTQVTVNEATSPRLSSFRYPYYPGDLYYNPAQSQVVDDIINKYVRKSEASPSKTTENVRLSSYSPAAKALEKADQTVNALRQSGVNPVIAVDKQLDADTLQKYGLLRPEALAGYWDRSLYPEAWRYGNYGSYPYGYGYWPGYRYESGTPVSTTTTVTTSAPVEAKTETKVEAKPVENLRASVSSISVIDPLRSSVSDAEFYKKYGFYPWGNDGRVYGTEGRLYGYDGLYGYGSGYYGGYLGGRLVDGKWTDSKFEGKWVDGKFVEGKVVDGKWIDGKFPIVDLYGGRYGYPYGYGNGYGNGYGYDGLYGANYYGGRLVDGKWTDSRFEGKWVDGKFVEGKVVDGKWVDGKFPVYDSRYWDSRYLDGRTSYLYPYTRTSVVDPLLVSTTKSDKSNYVRQYSVAPGCETTQTVTVTENKSENPSRKASQQVGEDDKFDFEAEKRRE